MDSLSLAGLHDPVQTPPQERIQCLPPPNGHPESTRTSPPPDTNADALKQRKAEIRAQSQTFGNIPDVPIFTHWDKRVDCSNDAVHRSVMAGICGNRKEGVYSVALSGLYEDNEDGGDVIIYTGAGGRERWTNDFPPKRIRFGPQTMDQSWDKTPNSALIISFNTGNPVRVIRSSRSRSQYAPLKGYRYDGLYKITSYWTAKGQNGKKICRCRLERLPDQPPIPVRPITISTSKRKRGKLHIPNSTSHEIPETPFSAPLAGSTVEMSGGLPNPPLQRANSEVSTQIDFNMGEVDPDIKHPQSLFPQLQCPSNPAALPRYRWNAKKNQLVRLPAPDVAQEPDAVDGEDGENRVEDEATLVPSEAGHSVHERIGTEYFSDTDGSPRYRTPDESPAPELQFSALLARNGH